MSEANKALIRRLVEEVQNQHKVDAIDEFLAPSFVNYDPLPGLPGTLEGAKQLHRMLFAAFPDLQMTIHDQAAEAQAEVAEVLRLNPKFSLEVHKQRVPIKDPIMLEQHITALRKAGLK